LGPIWTVLNRKYYVDEFYRAIFIRPAVATAQFLGRFDRSVIDRIVNWVGIAWRWISNALRTFFDEPIIDGLVNGVGTVTGWFGGIVRRIQTGQGQNYLLFAVLTILLVLGFYLYI
jgi:NADH-quinone oxidoreductase subunit L